MKGALKAVVVSLWWGNQSNHLHQTFLFVVVMSEGANEDFIYWKNFVYLNLRIVWCYVVKREMYAQKRT